MALVATSGLPAFETMRAEGVETIAPDQPPRSELPELTVGLLNLMPDAALRATDRQFVRMVSAYAGEAHIRVLPFTVAAENRGEAARRHVETHYTKFESLQESGMDALIVTGANPTCHQLAEEAFWTGLVEVLDWARTNVQGVLCSCLATHAVLGHYQGVERTRLPNKRWGVYSHRLLVDDHPLVRGITSPVDAPHSHWYDLTRAQMEDAGATVLLESDEAGVHMAVSHDDFYVFFQGHPEYEEISLLKEYKREVGRFLRDESPEYPPLPEHYFNAEGVARLDRYREKLVRTKDAGEEPPDLAESSVFPTGVGTWTDPGKVIYRNWLAEIQRRKTADRKPGAPHPQPTDPIKSRQDLRA